MHIKSLNNQIAVHSSNNHKQIIIIYCYCDDNDYYRQIVNKHGTSMEGITISTQLLTQN